MSRRAIISYSSPSTYTSKIGTGLTAGEFITSGLVLAYKFDELSGQVVIDYSPSALNGQMGNDPGVDAEDPTFVNPRGILCNNDFVRVLTPNTPLRLTTALSVEVRFLYTSGSNGGLYDKTDGVDTNKNYQVFFENDVLKFRTVKSGLNQDLAGPTLTTSVTYHTVATYDGVTMRMYVDGTDIGTTKAVASPIDNVDGFVLMGKLGSSVYPLLGTIYKISVYNRALTPAEVSTLYAH